MERALLRESVERFVSRSYDIEGRNALVRGTPGYSTAHWATFAELGWLAILIPESLGGIGAPFADALPLLEAFGGGLLLEPFTPAVVLSGTLLADAAASPAAAAALEALGEGRAQIATAYRDDGTRLVRVERRPRDRGHGRRRAVRGVGGSADRVAARRARRAGRGAGRPRRAGNHRRRTRRARRLAQRGACVSSACRCAPMRCCRSTIPPPRSRERSTAPRLRCAPKRSG